MLLTEDMAVCPLNRPAADISIYWYGRQYCPKTKNPFKNVKFWREYKSRHAESYGSLFFVKKFEWLPTELINCFHCSFVGGAETFCLFHCCLQSVAGSALNMQLEACILLRLRFTRKLFVVVPSPRLQKKLRGKNEQVFYSIYQYAFRFIL